MRDIPCRLAASGPNSPRRDRWWRSTWTAHAPGLPGRAAMSAAQLAPRPSVRVQAAAPPASAWSPPAVLARLRCRRLCGRDGRRQRLLLGLFRLLERLAVSACRRRAAWGTTAARRVGRGDRRLCGRRRRSSASAAEPARSPRRPVRLVQLRRHARRGRPSRHTGTRPQITVVITEEQRTTSCFPLS